MRPQSDPVLAGSRRLRRGAGAAVASTFIALMSHLIAGGAMPGLLGLAVPLLVATAVSSLFAGMRVSWLRLAGSVLISQLLFHGLFVLGAPASGAHIGHHASAEVMAAALHGSGSAMTHAGAGMWLAHAVAALITVLALRRGEVIAARLAGAVRRVVTRLVPALPLPVLPAPVRTPVVVERTRSPLTRMLTGGPTRRGPPITALPVIP